MHVITLTEIQHYQLYSTLKYKPDCGNQGHLVSLKVSFVDASVPTHLLKFVMTLVFRQKASKNVANSSVEGAKHLWSYLWL